MKKRHGWCHVARSKWETEHEIERHGEPICKRRGDSGTCVLPCSFLSLTKKCMTKSYGWCQAVQIVRERELGGNKSMTKRHGWFHVARSLWGKEHDRGA
jgi:hypothetical protein